jgi:hypothetical protein
MRINEKLYLLKRPIEKIREINRRYSKPRIKLSRGVKFSLLMLRLYLVAIVLLLLFKLITLIR